MRKKESVAKNARKMFRVNKSVEVWNARGDISYITVDIDWKSANLLYWHVEYE